MLFAYIFFKHTSYIKHIIDSTLLDNRIVCRSELYYDRLAFLKEFTELEISTVCLGKFQERI